MEGFALDAIDQSVAYEDNAVNLQGTLLPLPSPALPISF